MSNFYQFIVSLLNKKKMFKEKICLYEPHYYLFLIYMHILCDFFLIVYILDKLLDITIIIVINLTKTTM